MGVESLLGLGGKFIMKNLTIISGLFAIYEQYQTTGEVTQEMKDHARLLLSTALRNGIALNTIVDLGVELLGREDMLCILLKQSIRLTETKPQ